MLSPQPVSSRDVAKNYCAARNLEPVSIRSAIENGIVVSKMRQEDVTCVYLGVNIKNTQQGQTDSSRVRIDENQNSAFLPSTAVKGKVSNVLRWADRDDKLVYANWRDGMEPSEQDLLAGGVELDIASASSLSPGFWRTGAPEASSLDENKQQKCFAACQEPVCNFYGRYHKNYHCCDVEGQAAVERIIDQENAGSIVSTGITSPIDIRDTCIGLGNRSVCHPHPTHVSSLPMSKRMKQGGICLQPCVTHAECGDFEYCFASSVLSGGSYCYPREFCERDEDSVDGNCAEGKKSLCSNF